MADKLKQSVSTFPEFVAGEQPSPVKLNALTAQFKRALATLEYSIGDVLSGSWPYVSGEDTYLTIPWGRRYTLSSPVNGADSRGRALDIVSLARLVGPASNLNPQFLTDTNDQTLIGEEIPPDVNQFPLRYPPEGTLTFQVSGGGATTTFTDLVTSESELMADGDYYVSEDGMVHCYSPTGNNEEVSYTTSPAKWGGGSSYAGSTFNVIPDPSQLLNGTGLGVTGPQANGSYMITLPVITHQQKNFTSDDTALDKSNEPTSGEQLFLPKWMVENFTNGQVLPQGCIYLKCVDTNEVYTDATYIYDTNSTLEVTNLDIGLDGCGAVYCLITVGTDITTSIDDVRRKAFQHSHDRSFGEPFVSIHSIVDILKQGDADTSLGGPYFPSAIPGNFAPQYLHRDGYRLFSESGIGGFAAEEQDRGATSKGPSHNNALRGSLVIGVRERGSEVIEGTSAGVQAPPYTEFPDDRHYLHDVGESHYLTFGGVPVFHNKGGILARETALEQGSGSDMQASLDRLNAQAPQIYRSHWGELRIESQDGEAAYLSSGNVDSNDTYTSVLPSDVTAPPLAWTAIDNNPKRQQPNGGGLYARGSITLDNKNYSDPDDEDLNKSIYILTDGNLVENVGGFSYSVVGDSLFQHVTFGEMYRCEGSYYRFAGGEFKEETIGDYLIWAGRETNGKQVVISAHDSVNPDDIAAVHPYGHFSINLLTKAYEDYSSGTSPGGDKWLGVGIWNPTLEGAEPPSFNDYPLTNYYCLPVPPGAEGAQSAPCPIAAQLWVRGTHGEWDNQNWIAVFDNSISYAGIDPTLGYPNFEGNPPWSEGNVRGILVGTPGMTAQENAAAATIWTAFRASNKCVGKIVSYRSQTQYDVASRGEWLNSLDAAPSFEYDDAPFWSECYLRNDPVGAGSSDTILQTSGDVAYVSGGRDYGEYLPVGDPEEWRSSCVKEEYLNFKSGSIEGLAHDVPTSIQFGLPEGLLIRVRNGQIWKDGTGTPMFITHRPCVVGNQGAEIGGKPYDTVSFIGQLPVIVKGPASDGDLAVPDEGGYWCLAIPKEDASFEEYKGAVGTFWGSTSEDMKFNELSKVLCAVGVK